MNAQAVKRLGGLVALAQAGSFFWVWLSWVALAAASNGVTADTSQVVIATVLSPVLFVGVFALMVTGILLVFSERRGAQTFGLICEALYVVFVALGLSNGISPFLLLGLLSCLVVIYCIVVYRKQSKTSRPNRVAG